MSTDLKIYEQSVTYVDNRRRKQLYEICTVWGSELIEKLWKKVKEIGIFQVNVVQNLNF